ncbi:aaa family atpase [Ophiostoma piceae UAMH 11346]|uniref:Aaa family atpase n=1 Tax=Ophiostoma piceae (strain UAMH 11346) TaxID=1262450 RepID=S3CAT3_OPHP1|nr:aaa family atpase [Ophiostoma piceae UAMH 11346]
MDDPDYNSSLGNDEQPEQRMHDTSEVGSPKHRKKMWLVSGWQWTLSFGSMRKAVRELTLGALSSMSDDDVVDIHTLEFYPLQHTPEDTKLLIAKRANTFWKCKNQQFVEYEYRADDANGLDFATERFMVDINTYRLLYPNAASSQLGSAYFLDGGTIPTDGSMSICPSTVIGYNMRQKKCGRRNAAEEMRQKKWMDIDVDRIRTVQWNKQAFENLAIDKKTKNVVRALVSKQIATDMSTDLISGKGNGLIMLLHGGPGTGKTLTAVFLRVLEYYNGILILTSNRVGTFDEAFKSRIQLRIHYEPLNDWQCRKIWHNFLDRVNQLNPDELEYGELNDNIGELSKENMNGRQIRNVITTARQLAQFKGCKCGYEEVKDAIEVSTKFEKYLQEVKGGILDDDMAR